MNVPAPKRPKLPAIDVWVEPIDERTVALHAQWQWAQGPWLAAWRILTYPEPVRLEPWRWRVRGEQLLHEVEGRIHPRWYKHAQRSLERRHEYGAFDLQDYWAIREWNATCRATPEAKEPA